MENKILHSPMQVPRPELASGFGAAPEHEQVSLRYIWLNIFQGSLFQSGKSGDINCSPAGEELCVGNLWEAAENRSPAVAVTEWGSAHSPNPKLWWLSCKLQAASSRQY